MIDPVIIDGKKIAVIVRANSEFKKTSFVTEANDILQLGYIVYEKGKSITPHIHKKVERQIFGTPEVLYLQKGRMITNFYDDEKHIIGKVTLNTGDVIVLLEGGHGFEMLEDTVLMEVKQGPYLGEIDKEKFSD